MRWNWKRWPWTRGPVMTVVVRANDKDGPVLFEKTLSVIEYYQSVGVPCVIEKSDNRWYVQIGRH